MKLTQYLSFATVYLNTCNEFSAIVMRTNCFVQCSKKLLTEIAQKHKLYKNCAVHNALF